MKITRELAQPIVMQIMALLNYNINIMDENGVIVASGDSTRLNQTHEGALKFLKSKKEVILSVKDSARLSGTRPGINLPIEFQGDLAGVVGITVIRKSWSSSPE
ncbi:MAG TPA: sugar diacid recognition domain-containing protein [Paenibacillus sp.]|uniref:sugar diacid recognition domain-containing protein n=1 Tax=Paenibacillus sp. TaxID=58172 RepID=UPI002C2D793D|nr:sugar diacid recognition domain-containing protein [Paenibacillus sp.]HUC93455.1 sugar diacid recognition domain-containing protein [Paenibacillus sp.]